MLSILNKKKIKKKRQKLKKWKMGGRMCEVLPQELWMCDDRFTKWFLFTAPLYFYNLFYYFFKLENAHYFDLL